jgi:hypothetical protein
MNLFKIPIVHGYVVTNPFIADFVMNPMTLNVVIYVCMFEEMEVFIPEPVFGTFPYSVALR